MFRRFRAHRLGMFGGDSRFLYFLVIFAPLLRLIVSTAEAYL